MKHILFSLLLIFASAKVSAQRNNLFADIGLPPGLSVSYSYKLTNHFGVGIGLQVYSTVPTVITHRQFTPAAFADIRLYLRPKKANQLFVFLNPGIDLYQQNNHYKVVDNKSLYYVPGNAGLYIGLGLGYFRRITKRGGGPYASLKMISNWYTAKEYYFFSGKKKSDMFLGDGNLVFCLGFKF